MAFILNNTLKENNFTLVLLQHLQLLVSFNEENSYKFISYQVTFFNLLDINFTNYSEHLKSNDTQSLEFKCFFLGDKILNQAFINSFKLSEKIRNVSPSKPL